MYHFFNVDVAKLVGVNAAIVFECLSYWILTNQKNKKNYHDGCYWTYNTLEEWHAFFPYLGAKAFNSAMNTLVEKGLIKKGRYNRNPYDRTLWYAFTEEGESIATKKPIPFAQNGQMEWTEEDTPIPLNIPSLIPVANPTADREDTSDLVAQRFDAFWAMYPKHMGKKEAKKAWDTLHVSDSLFEDIMQGLNRQIKSSMWTKESGKYIPNPATWLLGERWEDDMSSLPSNEPIAPLYKKLNRKR